MNIDKFTITSYDQLTGFSKATGSLEMIMDELNDFALSHEEESDPITGRGGRTIANLKKSKKVTGKGTNGMLSGGALAAMVGSEVEDGDYKIRFTDPIVVTSNSATTTQKAVGTVGNEIGIIYVRDENKSYISGGRKLVQATGADLKTGEFSYDPETKTVTFFEDDVPDGTEVIAFYDATVTGKKISNKSDNYSNTLQVFIDCTCTDGCDNLFHGQFIIERADFNGTFDIKGGSEPSTLSFEFTSLPNLCTGKSNLLWDFVVFD